MLLCECVVATLSGLTGRTRRWACVSLDGGCGILLLGRVELKLGPPVERRVLHFLVVKALHAQVLAALETVEPARVN
jgi:hypothetical protein